MSPPGEDRAPAARPADDENAAPASPSPPASGVDLARVALRAAREQAKARGTAAQQRQVARRGGGLRSGARRDGRDPMRLGDAVDRLRTERGWETPMAVGGVLGRWPQIVGEEVARHCEPEGYDEQERTLTVRCDSTAWATQLRLLAPRLVARLNEALGQGSVRVIHVRGPQAPARRYGGLRAPGSRGPGDTYGCGGAGRPPGAGGRHRAAGGAAHGSGPLTGRSSQRPRERLEAPACIWGVG